MNLAYEQAARAVVALALGAELREVGFWRWGGYASTESIETLQRYRGARRAERIVRSIECAGRLAERRLNPDKRTLPRLHGEAVAEAEALVEQRWAAIERVAAILDERRRRDRGPLVRVPGDDVIAVLARLH
jgi:hypothetical protein